MTKALRLLALSLMLAGSPSDARAAACDASQFTYTFANFCTETVWIGQRSTADPNAYPPQSGNWAVGGICASNADCPSGVCDARGGRCTCGSSTDCSGGVCEADGKCGNTAVFCLPQAWSSGTFFPRTGCTLDASDSPEQLACSTGACFNSDGDPLLDCSLNNGGGSPTNPVTQFEVTSSSASVNYDVSIAAGHNVETKVRAVGGGLVVPGTPSTEIVGCYDAGCTADLNAICPAPLQVVDAGQVIGCLDPCTACQRNDPPAALACDATFADQWTSCSSTTGSTTYEDLYCAKNFADGHPQASPNQGTPTAFSQLDCPPVTSFVTPTFASGYALPAGQGVCLYTDPPQSTIQYFNDYGWADAPSGTTKTCGGANPLADGTACGGYLTTQSDGSYYGNAIGYTCQTATYPVSGGGTQTAHLCMPPTTSGLGVCTEDDGGGLPLYSGTGGVPNADWITAATAAGGGTTPYYVPFKTACQAAYAWQYDDIASGFACTVASAVSGGQPFSGFDVSFCGSNVEPLSPVVPDEILGLTAKGRRANKLDDADKGKLLVKGETTLPVDMDLADLRVSVADLLDEVGAKGELVDVVLPLALTPVTQKPKKAVFETDSGVEPRVKVVLHRPKTSAEKVKITVKASRATIDRPAACEATGDAASLETALDLHAGEALTRVGGIASWTCKKKALRGG